MERRSHGLAGLVALTAALAVGLHKLGAVPGMTIVWADPIGWVESARPDAILGSIARQIGLVVAYWVLLSALAYTVMVRTRRRSRLVMMLTLPGIRRIVDRGLAATLAVSIAAAPVGPALAAEPPPAVVFDTTNDGIPVPHVPLLVDDTQPNAEVAADALPATSVGIVAPSPITGMDPIATAPAGGTEPAAMPSAYEVENGDNLWSIAEQHLASVLDDPPTRAATASYWRQIVAGNRDTLRSGDPNLIYPGEVIALPAVEVSP